MSSHPRSLFDSSFAALTLVNAHSSHEVALRARLPVRRPRRGTVMAMSIQFAPESEPTANTLELHEEQTTGPLALGFEFELFGVYYTRFELSSNGFISLGPTQVLAASVPLSTFLSFLSMRFHRGLGGSPMRYAAMLSGVAWFSPLLRFRAPMRLRRRP